MRPLRDAIIWMDRRATIQAERVDREIGTEDIFRISGNRNDAYFGFNKILWIRDNEPDIWKRIRYFLPSNSYVVFRMTGEIFVDYTSAANIGGVYDLRKHQWSAEMLRRLEIDERLFPQRFCRPEEIVGTLTLEAASILGLRKGIPVCAGCTDCLASNLAAGILEEGQQSAIIGSSINWGVLSRDIPQEIDLVSMPNVVESSSLFYVYGGVSTAGALTDWFLQNIAPYTGQKDAVRKTDFAMLEAEAASIAPGCDGLITLPYFMGERSPIWDSGARGVFCGLSLSHSRAHLYRSILEATAFAARHIRESSRVFRNADNVCVVSGGASKSELWMQILADVTGLVIRRTSEEVQAPVGDALVAAMAVGAIPDYTVIHDWYSYKDDIFPDAERHALYSQMFARYRELYHNTRECIREICSACDENKEE